MLLPDLRRQPPESDGSTPVTLPKAVGVAREEAEEAEAELELPARVAMERGLVC